MSTYPCAHGGSRNCPHYAEGICPDDVVVPFCGPEDAPLIVIGEAPGRNEKERGVPFVGDSGQELDNLYLPAAGLRRERVAVANAVACLPPQRGSSRRPSAELVAHCSRHVLMPWLDRMLEERDRVVVCLGEISGSVVGQPSPPEPGIVHPLPGGWLLCAPHPAAAMRSASRAGRVMDEILLAFRTAGTLLRDPDSVFVGPEPCEMRLCSSVDDLSSWLGDEGTVAMDTETMGFASTIYCSSFAAGNRSAVLMATSTDWTALVDWLCRRRVVMHNAVYDIEAVAASAGHDAADRLLGVVEDTMLLAYEIRGLPLGLKPLASMLCGYSMRSYETTFLPQFRLALASRLRALADEWRSAVDTHPCCTLSGGLFGFDVSVPRALRPRRDETISQYRQRLRKLDDSVLQPLAGKRVEAFQGSYEFSCALLEEVDSRFSWVSAVETAISFSKRAESCQSVRELQKILDECRSSRLLEPSLPKSVHHLLEIVDQRTVAAYAAQDAEATLAVWRKLASIVEAEP